VTRFFCDLCGEEMCHRFTEGKYYRTKGDLPGTMLIVRTRVEQGDLCERCAREVVENGQKTIS
jgi:hypothetical protein